jgi:hypothetical protein
MSLDFNKLELFDSLSEISGKKVSKQCWNHQTIGERVQSVKSIVPRHLESKKYLRELLATHCCLAD